jgi:hypothetical protein
MLTASCYTGGATRRRPVNAKPTSLWALGTACNLQSVIGPIVPQTVKLIAPYPLYISELQRCTGGLLRFNYQISPVSPLLTKIMIT